MGKNNSIFQPKGAKTITPFQTVSNNVGTSDTWGAIAGEILGGYRDIINDGFNNAKSASGSSGGGANYFDPGPYLPPINTGPSFEDIDAMYQQFGLNKQGIDITDAKNQADYQNALAALGLSDTGAQQQATYQRGSLANQLGGAKLSWEKQLADLLSNATASGAITSKGYGQNVGFANQEYGLAEGQNQLDVTNVGNQLQQALAGNQLQRQQAGQTLGFAGQQNNLQRALIDNSRLQYDAGLRTQNQQNIQRQQQYDTQYNYTPYNQVRAYGTQG